MSAASPLISVAVPTRNRKDELRRTLLALKAQTVPVEIFVMDDASTDGTDLMMAAEFPDVFYERVDTPRGPTGARNSAARRATGEFLLTLDDDCELVSPQTVAQTLALFDHPMIGAVTVPFINIHHENPSVLSRASSADAREAVFDWWGGMIVFRLAAYRAAGGYDERLFMHFEESELTFRLMGAGFAVRLGYADPIHHHESPVRARRKLDYLGPRNRLLADFFNGPLPDVLWRLPRDFVAGFHHGARAGYLGAVVKGSLAALGFMLMHLCSRRPISPWAWRAAWQLRRSGSLPLAQVMKCIESVRESDA